MSLHRQECRDCSESRYHNPVLFPEDTGVIIWCGPAGEMDDTGIAEVHQFVHGLADGPLTLAAKAEARGG